MALTEEKIKEIGEKRTKEITEDFQIIEGRDKIVKEFKEMKKRIIQREKRKNSILESQQKKEISRKMKKEEVIRLIRQGDLIDAADLEGISVKTILGHLLELHKYKDNDEYMKELEEKGTEKFIEKKLKEYIPRVIE